MNIFHPTGPTEPSTRWLLQDVLVWYYQTFALTDSLHSDSFKTLAEQPPECAVASHMFLPSEREGATHADHRIFSFVDFLITN